MKTKAQNRIAKSFFGLAHPRRIRIFECLTHAPGGQMSYQKLNAELRICDSSLIHHLREMERAGLVLRYRKGVTAVYRLVPDQVLADIADVQTICSGYQRQDAGKAA